MKADQTTVIGLLPKAFIALAFLNFLVGASLGGWMAMQPAMWPVVASIHGEVNPFGWLTMLIYGMTYAVLSFSAGLKPPRAWVGWLQLACAELGVVAVAMAVPAQSNAIYQAGLLLQFVAPILFLANILSAVFSARRARREGHSADPAHGTDQDDSFAFLRRAPTFAPTDRVGQRGTDVSLLILIAGASWMLVHSFGIHEVQSIGAPPGALFLIYYGWIAGTVLSVALHLFPRFIGVEHFGPRFAILGQVGWGLGVLLGTVGLVWSPAMTNIAFGILGVTLVWFGLFYVWAITLWMRSGERHVRIPFASQCAWLVSWLGCLVLGLCLTFGLDPLSLEAMHLLFLVFITNLVYGIGYTLFPLLLRRKTPAAPLAIAQVALAAVGSVLMVAAFFDLQSIHPAGAVILLATGGTMAGIGAVVFILQWPLSKPV